jgi:hypothetical protein
MKFDLVAKFLLLVIAVSLSAIAVHLYVTPLAVEAQSGHALYFGPGTFTLRAPDASRSVLGEIAVDLRNGNSWGFPTLQTDPYPAPGVGTNAPVSHPFLIGKFALADTDKQ